MVAYLNVQCTESVTGITGDFLTQNKGKADRQAISPIFNDLIGMFGWMRENGWNLAEGHGTTFDPGRVEKNE
jgi:hypothetical protein